MGGKCVLLMQNNVLVLDGNELFHRVQVGVFQIMADSITAHHLLCVLINALVDENHVVMPLESEQSEQLMEAVGFADFHTDIQGNLLDVPCSEILNEIVGLLMN